MILKVFTIPRRSTVLKAIKRNLPGFSSSDSEQQDRAMFYCEEMKQILNISDSGELLNVWRYGLPYGWFL